MIIDWKLFFNQRQKPESDKHDELMKNFNLRFYQAEERFMKMAQSLAEIKTEIDILTTRIDKLSEKIDEIRN